MSAQNWKIILLAPLLAFSAGLAEGTAYGQYRVGSLFHCQRNCCPPPFRHCPEGPVRLRYRYACPKPVCDPCQMQNWGYYQPCWRRWPFPPDWNHCPTITPASQVFSYAHLGVPQIDGAHPHAPLETLPPPIDPAPTLPPLRKLGNPTPIGF